MKGICIIRERGTCITKPYSCEEEPAPEEDEEEADAADSMSDNSWPEDLREGLGV